MTSQAAAAAGPERYAALGRPTYASEVPRSSSMTTQPASPLCQCGHARDVHKEGTTNCTRCPSSGIWVDSMADWVFPCERYQPR